MASGKTTVAQALAERFPKSVHLKGDLFRRLIVNGQERLSLELTEEGEAQLQLRYRIATEAAKQYADAGFTVILQDIVLGKALQEAVDRLNGYDVSVVVLSPTADVLYARDQMRGKSGYKNRAEADGFDKVLREETPKIGQWVDSSKMTVRETVDAIMALAPVTSSEQG